MIPQGYKSVAAIVTEETHDQLKEKAREAETSVSHIIGSWIESGGMEPLVRVGKQQSVRRHKDELFVSIPRDLIRRCGIESKTIAVVSYSDNTMTVVFRAT